MGNRYDVCGVHDLDSGEWKIVTINGREIGVYNHEGNYYAVRNVCPHQQAELCKGIVTGTNLPSNVHEYIFGMEGEVLVCPWHGWEFDMKTGKSLFDPEKYRVKTYKVEVREERIVLVS